MKSSGFTFIELIIGITISAILSITLYMAFDQIQLSSKNLNRVISVDTRVTILQNVFERDITGVFVPDVTEVQAESKKSADSKKEKKQYIKSSDKKLEKIFFSENQNKNFKELTFITCNPLQVYGQVKPRIARVVYKLKENKDSKNSYSIFRSESLDIKYGSQVIEYEVIDNIKQISFEFIYPEQPKKEGKDKEKKAEKGKEFKVLNEWNSEKAKKDIPYIIPQYVNVNLVLWEDDLHNREQSFEFKYLIYTFDSQFEKRSRLASKMEGIFGFMQTLSQEAQDYAQSGGGKK